jgi:hypothetical protein
MSTAKALEYPDEALPQTDKLAAVGKCLSLATLYPVFD